jgi:3-hydroxyisobutyrate dehydrogenase-like beta-hydroxyacid dehydrogenase
MGEPMCINLVKKVGLPVFGYDARTEPCELIAQLGMIPTSSIGEVAMNAEVIFLSLPSIVEVSEVCNAIADTAEHSVKIIVDMSTSAVRETRELATKLQERQLIFVDAPVARSRQAAKDGTLSIMVGGTAETFNSVFPLLSCMGTDITHCGNTGSGQVVKIINNMTLFMTVHALAEALLIGRRAGVDGELLFDVMSKGSADSFALRVPGQNALMPGKFPENAFSTDYAIKDIRLALELARQGGVSAESAELTANLLEKTSAAGFGRAYYPAIIKLIEEHSIERSAAVQLGNTNGTS